MKALFAALWLVSGCASLATDQTVCAEYREIRCVGTVSCSFDRGRGCRVCRCDDITKPAPRVSPDANVAPRQ